MDLLGRMVPHFHERRLNFIYQEHKADGSESNFFRLENPGREDA